MNRDITVLALMVIGIILLVWLLVAAMPTAQAHTPEEIEHWEEEWEEDLDEIISPHGLSLGVLEALRDHLEERSDFEQRHRCHYENCTTTVHRNGSSDRSTNRGIGSNVEQWRDLVARYFSPGEVETALCLMKYESGGNPDAKNPRSSARGLMQVMASIWAPHFGVSYEDLYNPDTNMRIARAVWDQQGWWAWSPYKRGLCR